MVVSTLKLQGFYRFKVSARLVPMSTVDRLLRFVATVIHAIKSGWAADGILLYQLDILPFYAKLLELHVSHRTVLRNTVRFPAINCRREI